MILDKNDYPMTIDEKATSKLREADQQWVTAGLSMQQQEDHFQGLKMECVRVNAVVEKLLASEATSALEWV